MSLLTSVQEFTTVGFLTLPHHSLCHKKQMEPHTEGIRAMRDLRNNVVIRGQGTLPTSPKSVKTLLTEEHQTMRGS